VKKQKPDAKLGDNWSRFQPRLQLRMRKVLEKKDFHPFAVRCGRQRETTSAIISLDMIPINGCFKDVLQQWSLFFVVDCRLPSDGSH